jgi:hypothetical protein
MRPRTEIHLCPRQGPEPRSPPHRDHGLDCNLPHRISLNRLESPNLRLAPYPLSMYTRSTLNWKVSG